MQIQSHSRTSRLENNAESNVTVNTRYRIADALGYDLNVSVVRRSPPKPEKAAKTDTRKSRSRLATPGKSIVTNTRGKQSMPPCV